MQAVSPLTGLPGNERIHQEIQRLIEVGEPFSLLYADLDNFKSYNDHYGFLRGDEAIRFVLPAGCRGRRRREGRLRRPHRW